MENVTQNTQPQDIKMREGIILALQDKINEFNNVVENMTRTGLLNLVRNAASFPQVLYKGHETERKATEILYTIKDLQVELAILTIAEMQQKGEEDGIQKTDTTEEV